MVAYSLCVMLSAFTTLCVPLSAQECREGLRWYKANGYEAKCSLANQPLQKGPVTKIESSPVEPTVNDKSAKR